MTILELAWKTTQQVIIAEDNAFLHVYGYGSGFFLFYREKLFFLTAEHVIFPIDETTGERVKENKVLGIFNNINPETLQTYITPVNDFYTFVGYKIKYDEVSFIDIPDISFAIINKPFQQNFLTHELTDFDGKILVNKGEGKRYILSDGIDDLRKEDMFMVCGTVNNDIIDNIRASRTNAIHINLTYKETLQDGDVILSYPGHVTMEEWAGLSGAPVFNGRGGLVAILLRANDMNDTVIVKPIKKVLPLMDGVIKTLQQ